MPASYWPTSAELLRFLPEIILSLAATLIMVLEPFLRARQLFGHLAFGGLVAALGAAGLGLFAVRCLTTKKPAC